MPKALLSHKVLSEQTRAQSLTASWPLHDVPPRYVLRRTRCNPSTAAQARRSSTAPRTRSAAVAARTNGAAALQLVQVFLPAPRVEDYG